MLHKAVILGMLLSSNAYAEISINQMQLQEMLFEYITDARVLAAEVQIVDAVRRQNAQQYSLQTIKVRDYAWQASVANIPFKRNLQTNAAGQLLQQYVTENPRIYSEMFVTDNQGANVAMYPMTSDYWQGDEDKWQKAFNQGKGQVYVSQVAYDDSADTHHVQFSVPVKDDTATIGVLVVGIQLNYLESQRLLAMGLEDLLDLSPE